MDPPVAKVDNTTLEQLTSPLMTLAVPVIYIVVFVISTPCNIIALILLCGHTKRATPTVIYSINLCLADLLYSITLPLQVDYHLRRNDWLFGSMACGISTAAFYCNMSCSILTTSAIALERYCGVVHPLKSRNLWGIRKAVLTCILIWIVILAFQIPYVLYDFNMRVPQLNVTTCFDVLPNHAFKGLKGYVYFVTMYILFYVVPMVILVVCYYAVARALRQALDAGIHRSHKRTQILVIVAALCFIVCYLPNMIVQLIHMVYRGKGKSIYAYYKFTLSLNCLNCCFDPFLYYLASSELRQALWRLLRRWNCCTNVGEELVLSDLPSTTRGNQNDNRDLLISQ